VSFLLHIAITPCFAGLPMCHVLLIFIWVLSPHFRFRLLENTFFFHFCCTYQSIRCIVLAQSRIPLGHEKLVFFCWMIGGCHTLYSRRQDDDYYLSIIKEILESVVYFEKLFAVLSQRYIHTSKARKLCALLQK
jgi:hypothetical protein